MSEIVIRVAAKKDIPAFAQAVTAMVLMMESVGGRPTAPESTLYDLFHVRAVERVGKPQYLYLIAEAGSQFVGLLEASRMELSSIFQDRVVLHIHAVYVDVHFRRQGIARRLIEESLFWGREQKCEEAVLNVLVNNPALQLYQSMGFRIFEHEMTLSLSG